MYTALRTVKKALLGTITRAINRKVKLDGVTVNGVCKFNPSARFGEDCHFNGVTIDGPGTVQFGNHCHFGKNITIFTQNHNYHSKSALPYDKTFIVKPVQFGNYVWVGSSVIILPGSVIEDGVIIQAGAVVHGKLERCGIYGGNPAVKFASRDINTFDLLSDNSDAS